MEFDFDYKKLSSEQLVIDWNWHQNICQKKVDEIINNFNPNCVNPIKVSFRDGKYWVIDGVYTLAALKKMNGGKETMVDCKVLYGLTEKDEAHLFMVQ